MEKNTVLECNLPDAELIAKCRKWVSDLCSSGAKAWALRVPVDFERDPDILFNELAKRYEASLSPAPLSAEEMVDKVREILDDELDVTTDNWGHYVGTKGKDEAASRIAALLSQRQPVAPEREEEADREKAMRWFHNLPADEYDYYFEKHYPEKGPMSDEEVEAIWRKEGKPNAPKEETVGYYFSNEHGNEVTVLSTVGEWCLVSEEGKNRPYVLPLEFVEAIRNESSTSAENKGGEG